MRHVLLMVLAVLMCAMMPCTGARAAEVGSGLDGLTEILDVRVSNEENGLRIVVDAARPVEIKKMVLSKPNRVVVDIKNAWVSPKAKRDGPLKGRFASRLRVAQFDKSNVRVVVELPDKVGKYNVFTMEGGSVPGRIVLDFGEGFREDSSDGSAENGGSPKTGSEETDPILKEASGNTDSHEKDGEKREEKQRDDDEDAAGETSSIYRDISDITGLKGKSITIDPGHGGSDSGAIGPTGVMEKNVTLRISLELEKILKAEGATVYMTRTKDTEVSPKKANASDIEELQARCDIANKHKSDIFISIHMDSFTNRTAKGTTGYYYAKGSRRSRDLADKIRANIVDQLNTQSRGTQTCNFYVVRHTDMPATLIEVAFISHPEEEKLLDSKEGIRKAALAIADGIADYFG